MKPFTIVRTQIYRICIQLNWWSSDHLVEDIWKLLGFICLSWLKRNHPAGRCTFHPKSFNPSIRSNSCRASTAKARCLSGRPKLVKAVLGCSRHPADQRGVTWDGKRCFLKLQPLGVEWLLLMFAILPWQHMKTISCRLWIFIAQSCRVSSIHARGAPRSPYRMQNGTQETVAKCQIHGLKNYHTLIMFLPLTPLNINMEPENHLFEKEIHLPNLQILSSISIFQDWNPS